MEHLHNELKKEFQLERLILFSDAVFAIAITLLVIEIKVPELHEEFTDAALGQELLHLIPKFVGFLISFLIIGMYWTIHHRIFSFLVNYDRKLLWLNLFFLMSIVLMPFSSGLYGEYAAPRSVHLVLPYGIYTANICLTGILTLRLWQRISNPKFNLSENLPGPKQIFLTKARSMVVAFIFLLSFLAVWLWHPIFGRYIPFLIPVCLRLLVKWSDRHYPEPS